MEWPREGLGRKTKKMDVFESILQDGTATASVSGVSVYEMVVCTLASLALGVAIALIYAYRERHTRSFTIALALIPAITCVVIAMVNGSVGAGVAVAGAFSLVRFRSAPGTGRDIAFVFLAMSVGLAAGMGYIAIASVVTAVIGGAYLLLALSPLGRSDGSAKVLNVSVPESVDYTGMFDEVLARHTNGHELVSVKTGAMGTVYKLSYSIRSMGAEEDKALMDDVRCLNGNMEVAIFDAPTNDGDL